MTVPSAAPATTSDGLWTPRYRRLNAIAAAAICSGGPGISEPYARAAANDEDECEEGE